MIARLLRTQALLVLHVVLLVLIMLGQADGLPLLAVLAYWAIPASYTLWIAGRYARDWRKLTAVERQAHAIGSIILVALVWAVYYCWPPSFAR